MSTLFPDLDPQAAANNLGVTLNHLRKALEPWRRSGEPSYLVHLDGPTIDLRTGAHLQIDIDEFERHLTEAARAESEGNATAALEHHQAAAILYRNDYLIDLADADWLDLERVHYRSRFIASATRAAQLLTGRGDTVQAEQLAQRILRSDPWNEDAYTVLATAALTRGDHTNARATLGKCLDALADLDTEPSPTTLELTRRCGIPPTATAPPPRP